jgi:hypothetical protein
MAIVALYDACALYPAPLRDLLMQLAMMDLFSAKWTNAIHDEWIRNVLIQRPDLRQAQLERTRKLMNAHVLDCLVEGYEPDVPALMISCLQNKKQKNQPFWGWRPPTFQSVAEHFKGSQPGSPWVGAHEEIALSLISVFIL